VLIATYASQWASFWRIFMGLSRGPNSLLAQRRSIIDMPVDTAFTQVSIRKTVLLTVDECYGDFTPLEDVI
jgi:hypothetical protein